MTIDYELLYEDMISKPNVYNLKDLTSALQNINDQLLIKANQIINTIITNLTNEFNYHYDHSYTPISPQFFKVKENCYALCNGWIQDQIQGENPAESLNFYYLKRQVNMWCDTIKLRFGKSKGENKFLWKYYKYYVQQYAKIFQGFRLDNLHNTDVRVAQYMLRQARKVNPNLLLIGELFSDSQTKADYCKKLGVNFIVAETIREYDQYNLYRVLHIYSNESYFSLGKISKYSFESSKILRRKYIQQIVYDQTHDNESYSAHHGPQQALSTLAQISFSKTAYGSVKGYDEFYNQKTEVYNEFRTYQKFDDMVKYKNQQYFKVQFLYWDTGNNNFDQIKEIEVKGEWDNWQNAIILYKINNIYQADYEFNAQNLKDQYQYKFIVDGVWKLHSEQNQNHENNVLQPKFYEKEKFLYKECKMNLLNEQDFFCGSPIAKKKQKINTNIVNKYGIKNKAFFSNLSYARRIINELRYKLDKYNQMYSEIQKDEITTIARMNKNNSKSYYLITRNDFKKGQDLYINHDIQLPGNIIQINSIFVPLQYQADQNTKANPGQFNQNAQKIQFSNNLLEFGSVFYKNKTPFLKLTYFPPGSVIILKTATLKNYIMTFSHLEQILGDHLKISTIFNKFSAQEINYVLYSSEEEEKTINNTDIYNIPDFGKLIFAGFAGLFQIIKDCCMEQNLAHPLFQNIRNGDWLFDYLTNRLKIQEQLSLNSLLKFLEEFFQHYRELPTFVKPKFFAKLILFLQKAAVQSVIQKSINALDQKKFHQFLKTEFGSQLLLSQYQFISAIQNPQQKLNNQNVSMSAGLPHFAVGWTRQWGRDTFIAFKSVLLLTGNFNLAKEVIFQFAATLRHGLMPNLLDNQKNPRFNNRDACWWFIKSVFDYIKITKDNFILKQRIECIFKQPDYMPCSVNPGSSGVINDKQTYFLYDIIQNIFTEHYAGISFIEWNAGFTLDHNMQNKGFKIQLKQDQKSGFIKGGNCFNCLTWMDKMGSSGKAGNKGIPGTSRDGCPIEMTCILKKCISTIIELNKMNLYPYSEVKFQDRSVTFEAWGQKIQANFEKFYWIESASSNMLQMLQTEDNVQRRGIYRDTVYCSGLNQELLLRPNGCVGIALAPELFDNKHCFQYLQKVQKYLLEEESIGVKSLDPQSKYYYPFYDNQDDSNNFNLAQGYSYHNGPEWVWTYGYLIQALCQLSYKLQQKQSNRLFNLMQNHAHFIRSNIWQSLPEITNANGEMNRFSCPSQAWSVGTILEACYMISN